MVTDHPDQNLTETLFKYAMVYSETGDIESAQHFWQKCIEQEDDWSVERLADLLRLWNFRERDIEALLKGLEKAGIKGADSVTN